MYLRDANRTTTKEERKKKSQSTFKNDRYQLEITGFTQRFLCFENRTNLGWIEIQ